MTDSRNDRCGVEGCTKEARYAFYTEENSSSLDYFFLINKCKRAATSCVNIAHLLEQYMNVTRLTEPRLVDFKERVINTELPKSLRKLALRQKRYRQ